MPEIKSENHFDVIIAGGGLAGLVSAILLSREKKKVLLIEKKSYPFHKVCGEYVSNEVLEFLQSIGFDPFSIGASRISKLRISSPSGKEFFSSLDLGGFGLSRYLMDDALHNVALKHNSKMLTSTKVTDISFQNNYFFVKTNSDELYSAKLVIGSYGKRDALDKKLNRNFIQSHTGYMAVKYHIKTNYPLDEIGLDNFENGYCGIVKIEEDKFNLCYLFRRSKKVIFNSISELEEKVLFKNPVLKKIFSESEFLFDQPEVINEVSFEKKRTVEGHILMCGDAAGLITPLCGNGMSMAIHSAKLLSELILKSEILERFEILSGKREELEKSYHKTWNQNFRKRLFIGRAIQNLFGNPFITGLSLKGIHAIPSLERLLISSTHGKPI